VPTSIFQVNIWCFTIELGHRSLCLVYVGLYLKTMQGSIGYHVLSEMFLFAVMTCTAVQAVHTNYDILLSKRDRIKFKN
jgi:hypothetical protein